MANVRLQDITKQFGRATIVEDISFEIPDGQFWVLVGPSGCGKSTILRTIAGLESATSGDIYIGDRLINQIPARQRDVAMVFQNYALYPHMSVAENLAFGMRMRQVDTRMIQERIVTVARLLSIEHLLDRKPRQLSGGQQQRVALGRAIARQPQVFLLDEPLSNLDAQLRDGTRAELKQLHERVKITTVYVTHDQVEAMTLADQIVVLNQGRVQQIGDPQTIYAQPANRMVATFLGNPPMNILKAIYDGEQLQINGQAMPTLAWLSGQLQLHQGQQLELGIRPEHLKISDETSGDLTVQVSLVEPLGRETLIRAEVAESRQTSAQIVNLQVAPGKSIRAGDRLSLKLDPEQMFVFDPVTGNRQYPE